MEAQIRGLSEIWEISMNKNKIVKGQYGYIKKQRTRVIIRTVCMFGLSLAIFGIGIWSTKTKANLLTVVAILGCLPASKSAVNMIMFLRAKGCSEKAYGRTKEYSPMLTPLYDLIFTSYEKNYQVSHMVIKDNIICGYTEDSSCEEAACGKHIETLLKQGGCKNVTVKIYKDLEKYCEGLDNLLKQPCNETEKHGDPTEDILLNLLAISL